MQQPEQSQPVSKEKSLARGVTLRAVVIVLLFAPFNSYWLYLAESVKYTGHPTCLALFYNAITLLLVLLLLNAPLKRWLPSKAFSQAELLTIYIMTELASVAPSHDMLQILVPVIVYPFRFATAENQWDELFIDRLPTWLTVRQPEAVKGFFEGATTFYTWPVVKAWLVPGLAWMAFFLVLTFVLLCFTTLLRRQWTERERLTYPLTLLPLELTSNPGRFFRNRLLWIGLALAASQDILAGLTVLYPAVPSLNLKAIDLQTYLVVPPWNAVGWFPLRLYPFAVGLGVLLPVELAFSAWFFYLLLKAQLVFGALVGWSQTPGYPWPAEQSFGALIGLFVFALWTGRRNLLGLLSSITKRGEKLDDEREPLPYRVAAFGALGGLIILFAFGRFVGMANWLTVAFLAIYIALAIAQARMRAELGPPVQDFYLVGPDSLLPKFIGPHRLGRENLVGLTLNWWYNRSYRSHPMPLQLEGFKLAERGHFGYRKLAWAMMLALGVGFLSGLWAELHAAYQFGALAKMQSPRWFGMEPWARLESFLRGTGQPEIRAAWAASGGLVLTVLLNSLRMRLMWFPFHPVGFALAGNWSTNLLWVSFFIAWLAKLLIMRYGGLRLYRTVLPFFLGLVLGEFLIATWWNLFGIVTGLQTFNMFP